MIEKVIKNEIEKILNESEEETVEDSSSQEVGEKIRKHVRSIDSSVLCIMHSFVSKELENRGLK